MNDNTADIASGLYLYPEIIPINQQHQLNTTSSSGFAYSA